MRKDRRGEQVFEPVSWDEALDHVAKRLLEVREEHGPEALAMFSHGCGSSWFKDLMKAYGTGSVAHPSYAQCRGSRAEAFTLTYGAPVGSPEPRPPLSPGS
jgi:thiosulfate reductase/polysulfide reductase chain A